MVHTLSQRRRMCEGSRARAPSERILWGLGPHRNFSYLSNNIHIYIRTYMSIFDGNCRSGPPRNFSKSAPLGQATYILCIKNTQMDSMNAKLHTFRCCSLNCIFAFIKKKCKILLIFSLFFFIYLFKKSAKCHFSKEHKS